MTNTQKEEERGEAARSEADLLLCTALDVGENMLKCGGEIRRIEDTVARICRAYGAAHVEVFSIPSLLLASLRLPDGSYSSQTRRIRDTSRDLGRLEAYNRISRRLCAERPDLARAQEMIHEVKTARGYPPAVVYLGAALSAGAFCVFFGGRMPEALCAAGIGALLTFVDRVRKTHINLLMYYALCAFLIGLSASLLARLGLVAADKVIIGGIMLLLPGLAFDCALSDLLCGDLLSGALGLIQALLLAAMIAAGLTLSLLLLGGGL